MQEIVGGKSSHVEGKAPTISFMSGFPRYHTFNVRGVIAGHKVTILIDSGDSHNFIDTEIVEWRGIPAQEFNGFTIVPGNMKWIVIDAFANYSSPWVTI